MIGKIRGLLIEVTGNIGLIETFPGVCFEVYLTPRLLSRHQLNSTVEIYTYLHLKEDQINLFGFESRQDFDFFKNLIRISGIGPKTAFNILSFYGSEKLKEIIKNNDIETLGLVPGLSKKTAMKIIIELSSKLRSAPKVNHLILSEEDQLVVEALVSLGFQSKQVRSIVARLPRDLTLEEKIKEALKIKDKESTS
ncbi:MAG: Holliday junction branch migration protein RuvA [Patescibacteria group bacterium]|nr:Holliday junction branch migration protein RuvA [Patescibacteria group bacterium]